MKKEKQDFKLSVSNIYFSKILLTGLILFLVIEFKIKLNFFFFKAGKIWQGIESHSPTIFLDLQESIKVAN